MTEAKSGERLSMVCPPVQRDNPRALASGLSSVQADEPRSVSLETWYPKETLHKARYVMLKI